MAKQARVVIHRDKVDRLVDWVAEGVAEFGRAVVDSADPPDRAPTGRGLVQRGGVIVYHDGRQVSTYSRDGRQPRPPKDVQPGRGITMVAGFSFPGRFLEDGTVKMRARPFLRPALAAQAPRAGEIIRRRVEPRLRG